MWLREYWLGGSIRDRSSFRNQGLSNRRTIHLGNLMGSIPVEQRRHLRASPEDQTKVALVTEPHLHAHLGNRLVGGNQ